MCFVLARGCYAPLQAGHEQAYGFRMSPWRSLFVITLDAQQRISAAELCLRVLEELTTVGAYTANASVLLVLTNVGPESEGLVDFVNTVLEACRAHNTTVKHEEPALFTSSFVEAQYAALSSETFLHRREMEFSKSLALPASRARPTVVGVMCLDTWSKVAFTFEPHRESAEAVDRTRAHVCEVARVVGVTVWNAPADAAAVQAELHRVAFDSTRAMHAGVPLSYIQVFHALQQLKEQDIVSNLYVRKEYFKLRNTVVEDVGSVGHRSSLLFRRHGPNSYVDRDELVRHLSRCLTASDAKLRCALVFLHRIGALHCVEPMAPASCINLTVYLQPQFLAGVISRSRKRIFRNVPRPDAETERKTVLEDARMQSGRTVNANARSSLLMLAMNGNSIDFYDVLSRELWLATSKFTIIVTGFNLPEERDVVAKYKNIPHEAVTFNVFVEVQDRTRSVIASETHRKR